MCCSVFQQSKWTVGYNMDNCFFKDRKWWSQRGAEKCLTFINRLARHSITCPVFILWNATSKCPHWEVCWSVKIHPPLCHPDAPVGTYKRRCFSSESVKRSKVIFTAALIRFPLYLERKLGLKVREMLSECWEWIISALGHVQTLWKPVVEGLSAARFRQS